jgi:hypothetical protein
MGLGEDINEELSVEVQPKQMLSYDAGLKEHLDKGNQNLI